MEFAIAMPQTYPDPVRIQRFLKRAEDLPFVAAWCIEQVIGTVPNLGIRNDPSICGCGDETIAPRHRRFADRSAQCHRSGEGSIIA